MEIILGVVMFTLIVLVLSGLILAARAKLVNSGDVIIEAVYENHPVKGELTIVKKGEVLDGFKDDFT